MIINRAGNILFHFASDSSVDSKNACDLMAGFYKAVQQFSECMDHGAISAFHMATKKVFIRDSSKLPLSYVLMVDQKSKLAAKPKKLEEFVTKIMTTFETRYDASRIQSWNGDIAAFCDFKDCLTGKNAIN